MSDRFRKGEESPNTISSERADKNVVANGHQPRGRGANRNGIGGNAWHSLVEYFYSNVKMKRLNPYRVQEQSLYHCSSVKKVKSGSLDPSSNALDRQMIT